MRFVCAVCEWESYKRTYKRRCPNPECDGHLKTLVLINGTDWKVLKHDN
jgi:hypothetical protein